MSRSHQPSKTVRFLAHPVYNSYLCAHTPLGRAHYIHYSTPCNMKIRTVCSTRFPFVVHIYCPDFTKIYPHLSELSCLKTNRQTNCSDNKTTQKWRMQAYIDVLKRFKMQQVALLYVVYIAICILQCIEEL